MDIWIALSAAERGGPDCCLADHAMMSLFINNDAAHSSHIYLPVWRYRDHRPRTWQWAWPLRWPAEITSSHSQRQLLSQIHWKRTEKCATGTGCWGYLQETRTYLSPAAPSPWVLTQRGLCLTEMGELMFRCVFGLNTENQPHKGKKSFYVFADVFILLISLHLFCCICYVLFLFAL